MKNTLRILSILLILGTPIAMGCEEFFDDDSNIIDSSGELSDDVRSDTTLAGENYIVRGRIDVRAELRIEPGTTLEFDAGAYIRVRDGGSLIAEGTEDEPILFTGTQQQPGWWNGIQFRSSEHPNNRLHHVIVEYAGYDLPGNVVLGGSNRLLTGAVEIQNSIMRHGAQSGLFVYGDSELRNFANNTFYDNLTPAAVPAHRLHQLDSGSTYLGNENDFIPAWPGSRINSDITWPALEVPYRIDSSNDLDVRAVLTIEAGTTIEFGAGSQVVFYNENAALIAEGTAEDPITFTGSDQVPGWWHGLYFRGSENIQNLMSHTVVEYAGGDSDRPGNIILGNNNTHLNGRLEVRDSVIRHSDGYGIYVHSGSELIEENNQFSNNANGDINEN